MNLQYTFLVLEEHPYGRQMLQALLNAGFIPNTIIQEVSSVADVEREKFLTRMAGQPIAPRINQLIVGRKIPLYSVADHNDEICRQLLLSNNPDLIVLGGTRIIKPSILEIPGQVTLNAHPGLLPWLRGSASVGWALYKDFPQGATVHFIDPGIDTGDIILREELPVYHHDTYESLNSRVAELAAQLMVRAMRAFAAGDVPRTPQPIDKGETLRVIPDDLLVIGIQRLIDGTYSHFSD
jgi:methionyl-tRNA formyltransferase